MKQLSDVLISREGSGLSFWCPGCEESHTIYYGEGPGPRWNWNGNEVKPTLTPSVLARSGHFAGGQEGNGCWCTYNKEHPEETDPFTCHLCHTYITDGRIHFLPDCSHGLAGHTVDMVGWPEGR